MVTWLSQALVPARRATASKRGTLSSIHGCPEALPILFCLSVSLSCPLRIFLPPSLPSFSVSLTPSPGACSPYLPHKSHLAEMEASILPLLHTSPLWGPTLSPACVSPGLPAASPSHCPAGFGVQAPHFWARAELLRPSQTHRSEGALLKY